MKIGNRVRLLRGTEEGIVVEIKNNKIVEVEIEDGFVIPALINEVVLIDSSEADSFHKDEVEPVHPAQPTRTINAIADGIYLGLDNQSSNDIIGYLINQTNSKVLFSISQQDKKKSIGRAYGICERYEIKEIGKYTSSIFNQAKKLNIDVIFHDDEAIGKKQPLTLQCSISNQIFDNKTYIESIDKEVAIINLEADQKLEIDARSLQEQMMETKQPLQQSIKDAIKKPGITIDLHFDEESSRLNASEIQDHQLNEFEKAFDNALVMNCEKLKVIHGVGAGILRKEIHKRLSRKTTVKYFEDADKERFGFGSTLVFF